MEETATSFSPAAYPATDTMRFAWVIIAMLLLLGVINVADKVVLGLAAIPIIKELHLSLAQYGLVSGSFFWLYALSSILMSAWSDTVGTKRVLTLLGAIWSAIQFATLFVTTFPALLLTRVVLGAGEGPYSGTAIAATAKWLAPERRTFGLAVMTCGVVAGPAVLAPLLTALIVQFGWRSAFAALGILGAVWVIVWMCIAREGPVASNKSASTSPSEAKTFWPEVLPVLFSRTFLLSVLVGFANYWVYAMLLSWSPVYLMTVRHLTLTNPLYIAAVTLPWIGAALYQIGSGWLVGYLFRRTGSGRRSYVYIASAVLIASALCLSLAMIVPSALGAVICLTLVPATAISPIIQTIFTGITPAARRGSVLGIAVALLTIPGFLAPTITGGIIQAAGQNIAGGFNNAYFLASVVLLVTGIVYLAFVYPDKAMKG